MAFHNMRIIIFLLFFFQSLNGNAQTYKYNIYCNPRFKYCVHYPSNLIPQREAENGDGRTFNDKGGHVILTVYGCRNEDAAGDVISLNKMYQFELNGGQFKDHTKRVITYSKLGRTFFIISGTENGKIFYQKTIQLQNAFGNAILEYSEGERDFYSAVSNQIFHSFKQSSKN